MHCYLPYACIALDSSELTDSISGKLSSNCTTDLCVLPKDSTALSCRCNGHKTSRSTKETSKYQP